MIEKLENNNCISYVHVQWLLIPEDNIWQFSNFRQALNDWWRNCRIHVSEIEKKLKDRYLIKTFHIEIKRWKLHILDIWLILTEISYWFLMKKIKAFRPYLTDYFNRTITNMTLYWLQKKWRRNLGF